MRPRPYIPLKVRVRVLTRQIQALGFKRQGLWLKLRQNSFSDRDLITAGLTMLFGAGTKVHLDHDPALILRVFDERTGEYDPPANDPNFLVYRAEADHDHKTFGRKQDAERTVTTKGSDAWLAKKFRRLERPQRQKRKIPSRGFEKRSRPWPKRH